MFALKTIDNVIHILGTWQILCWNRLTQKKRQQMNFVRLFAGLLAYFFFAGLLLYFSSSFYAGLRHLILDNLQTSFKHHLLGFLKTTTKQMGCQRKWSLQKKQRNCRKMFKFIVILQGHWCFQFWVSTCFTGNCWHNSKTLSFLASNASVAVPNGESATSAPNIERNSDHLRRTRRTTG